MELRRLDAAATILEKELGGEVWLGAIGIRPTSASMTRSAVNATPSSCGHSGACTE